MTAPVQVHRGSVVLVRLDPPGGRGGRATGPAVVVSNEAACRADTVLQVVPLADPPDRPLRPWEAAIGAGASGLERPARALANQLRTVLRDRVVRVLGTAAPDEIEALEEALRIQLGI